MQNLANVLANGIFPAAATPAATLNMFCSAIRHSRNWSGRRLYSQIEYVEFFTSPSSATTRSSASPSASSAAPYACRVASGLPDR
jgi:hypothetical protein